MAADDRGGLTQGGPPPNGSDGIRDRSSAEVSVGVSSTIDSGEYDQHDQRELLREASRTPIAVPNCKSLIPATHRVKYQVTDRMFAANKKLACERSGEGLAIARRGLRSSITRRGQFLGPGRRERLERGDTVAMKEITQGLALEPIEFETLKRWL
jgi:hypothetical protein